MVDSGAQADFAVIADQLTRLELGERSASRWLTTAASALVIASLCSLAAAVIFALSAGETVAKVLGGVGGAGAFAALVLATWGFLSGGLRDRAAERIKDLSQGGARADYVGAVTEDLHKRERSNADRGWRLRASAAALLGVVVFGAAAGAVDAIDGDESPDGGGREASTGQGGDGGGGGKKSRLSDDQLARRFRPVLLFDTSERWRPLGVETFFAERRHRGCRPQQTVCPLLSAVGDLGGLDETGSVLQVNGRPGRDKPEKFVGPDPACQSGRALDCDSGPGSRIYYHVDRRAEGLAYIDYWWYLRFNDAQGKKYDHQSDWEGVVVAVDVSEADPIFDWVGFAAHEGVWRYLRDSLRCDGQPGSGSCGSAEAPVADRVNVYVANGTHAAYPYPCRSRSVVHICAQNAKVPFKLLKRFSVPERGFDGKHSWAANYDSEALARFPNSKWVTWPGRWDARGAVDSPGNQQRYKEPGTATRGTCPASVCPGRLPPGYAQACFGWFGPNAMATACVPEQVGKAADSDAAAPFSVYRADVNGNRVTADLAAPTASSAPGVAQVTGAYLAPDEAIVVEGKAPETTQLYVRARRGEVVVEARFADLGLEQGGKAIVRSEPAADGGLTLGLDRPNGEHVSAAHPVVLAAPQPAG